MKRTKALLAATGTAMVLLISACSSTAGTPSAAGNVGTTAAPTTAQSTDAAPTQATDQTQATDVTEPTEESSDGNTSVQNGSGDIDGDTAAWATTYCEGLKPVVDEAKNMSDLQSQITNDPQTGLKTAGELFQKWGDAFTTTADKLKALPAPKVSGGEEFASKTIPLLSEVGTTFSSLGEKFVSGDLSAAGELAPSLTKLGEAMQGMTTDPELAAAFMKVPACQGLTG